MATPGNVTVDWGDGSADTVVPVSVSRSGHWSFENVEHEYETGGEHTITVTGVNAGTDTVDVETDEPDDGEDEPALAGVATDPDPPTTGVPLALTLTGENFADGDEVWYSVNGGEPQQATDVVVVNATTITAQIGALLLGDAPATVAVEVRRLGVGTAPVDVEVEAQAVPFLVGAPTIAENLAGSTLTYARPGGLQVGDWLIAVNKGQVTGATDYTCPGFARLGPLFVPSEPTARNFGFYGKPVLSPAAEPASYVFTRGTAGRNLGALLVIRGMGDKPLAGYFDDYDGAGVWPLRVTDAYPVLSVPALQLFAASCEYTAGAAYTLSTDPAASGMTQIVEALTNTAPSTSRTSLRVFEREVDASPAPAVTIGWTAGITSSVAQSVSLAAPVETMFENVEAAFAKTGFTSGHRGDSTTYAEMSADAYLQSMRRGHSVLELSVARTVGGVWFGLHDADINRTSELVGQPPASEMSWAAIQAYQITIANLGADQPYARLDDLLTLFKANGSPIVMVDPKVAWGVSGNRDEFFEQLQDYPQDRLIIKGFITTLSVATEATERSLPSWGYGYDADALGPNWATNQAPWTYLGMDIGATQPAWDATLATGKDVVAHIAANRTQYEAGMARGAVGVQCGGAAVIPAVNAAS